MVTSTPAAAAGISSNFSFAAAAHQEEDDSSDEVGRRLTPPPTRNTFSTPAPRSSTSAPPRPIDAARPRTSSPCLQSSDLRRRRGRATCVGGGEGRPASAAGMGDLSRRLGAGCAVPRCGAGQSFLWPTRSSGQIGRVHRRARLRPRAPRCSLPRLWQPRLRDPSLPPCLPPGWPPQPCPGYPQPPESHPADSPRARLTPRHLSQDWSCSSAAFVGIPAPRSEVLQISDTTIKRMVVELKFGKHALPLEIAIKMKAMECAKWASGGSPKLLLDGRTSIPR